MGMKKIMNLTYLAAALLGVGMVSSCSDSSIEAEDLTQGGETANVYANICVLVQNNSSSGSRAEEDDVTATTLEGETTTQGTTDEATVKKVNIYVFSDVDNKGNTLEAGKGILLEKSEGKDASYITYTSDANDQTHGNVSYNSSVVFKSLEAPTDKPKTYRLYAIANPENYDLNNIEVGMEESKFLEKVTLTYKANESAWINETTNGLPMANRAFVAEEANSTDHKITYAKMTVQEDNSSTNPATANIELERLVAKYELQVEIGTGEDKRVKNLTENGAESNISYATVTIDGYSPFNLNTESYAIRHRSTNTSGTWSDFTYCNLDNMETTTNSTTNEDKTVTYTGNWNGKTWKTADYVVDPYTKEKVLPADITYKESLGLAKNNWIHNGSDGTFKETRSYTNIEKTDIDSKVIGYSFENTTTADAQYMENSTGLMFRATLSPAAVYQKKTENKTVSLEATSNYPDSIYYYNYKFYADSASLYTAYPTVLPVLEKYPENYKKQDYTDNDNTNTDYGYLYNGKYYITSTYVTMFKEETGNYYGDADNKNYEVYEDIDKAKAAAEKAQKDEEAAIDYRNCKLLHDYGVTVYHKKSTEEKDKGTKEYYCYYPYIFKHYSLNGTDLSTTQKTMTPMKFAVVRNNWYKVKVTDILTIGRGTPEPDPYTPTPDEETEVWLKVNLSVIDWVVRTDKSVTLK